ncbi:MAG: hypothetical protein KC592_05525 [Nitrospira sp.]|nr:hypothetical protein [Nitrospira sp.]
MKQNSNFLKNLREVRRQAMLKFLWAEYPDGIVIEHFKVEGMGPTDWSFEEIEQAIEDLASCGKVKLRPSPYPGLVRIDLVSESDIEANHAE